MYGVYAYTPLTPEQADNWLGSVSYDVVVDMTIDYDRIEHTTPIVSMPKTTYVLFETDLFINYHDPITISISNFVWTIPIENQTIYNFVEPQTTSIWPNVFWFGSGLVIGFGIGYAIGNVVGVLK